MYNFDLAVLKKILETVIPGEVFSLEVDDNDISIWGPLEHAAIFTVLLHNKIAETLEIELEELFEEVEPTLKTAHTSFRLDIKGLELDDVEDGPEEGEVDEFGDLVDEESYFGD